VTVHPGSRGSEPESKSQSQLPVHLSRVRLTSYMHILRSGSIRSTSHTDTAYTAFKLATCSLLSCPLTPFARLNGPQRTITPCRGPRPLAISLRLTVTVSISLSLHPTHVHIVPSPPPAHLDAVAERRIPGPWLHFPGSASAPRSLAFKFHLVHRPSHVSRWNECRSGYRSDVGEEASG
jgi:hypothetical protein